MPIKYKCRQLTACSVTGLLLHIHTAVINLDTKSLIMPVLCVTLVTSLD